MGASYQVSVHALLSCRTTSEALYLSTPTGVVLNEIVKVKLEERTRRFRELVPNISTALLIRTVPGQRTWATMGTLFTALRIARLLPRNMR